jgi:small subunit ribosomal protein S8
MAYCRVSENLAGDYLNMSPTANMLIKVKNAQIAKADEVVIPFSKMNSEICRILKEKDFIKEFEKKKGKVKKVELPFLSVKLKYLDGEGAISGIKLISRPSRRIYVGREEIRPVRNGFGLAIFSTSKGLMTGDEAKKTGLGGEFLFEIW